MLLLTFLLTPHTQSGTETHSIRLPSTKISLLIYLQIAQQVQVQTSIPCLPSFRMSAITDPLLKAPLGPKAREKYTGGRAAATPRKPKTADCNVLSDLPASHECAGSWG
jgi:hypothetical protein